ncbi:sensor histidine kinase [Henriciella mobilis]|uniref:sensor histidine kinase n=1 Tax=Henriciella mobilis TaxID=2305467 RepID=UPI000E66A453|nr:HAMP domain-containing sensor histidine kinase [Henriciella mobilis]RIJ15786.1 sensor histidine kinase [Henriciella mobilis]RIJ20174.1 sensor histidine kinase [Henriciella mobilis]
MLDTRFVLSRDLLRSTYFRFAFILTSLFVAAYFVAGWIALGAIGDDLDDRVEQAAILRSLEMIEMFEAGGREALIIEVNARALALDPEDDLIWLGTSDGAFLAGHLIPNAVGLETGDVSGTSLGQDDDDTYFLLNKPFDGFRLISARSYEETDDISAVVLSAFGGATALLVIISGLAAIILSRSGQSRIDHITDVLRKIGGGELGHRIETNDRRDDLGRLSTRINEALDQLESTVGGIKQVSADIAHDLRTPINRLGIRLERLQDRASGSPVLEKELEEATGEIEKITTTFDALLRISQIEAGARKAKFGAVPLADIAGNLSEAYEAVVEDAGQKLVSAVAKEACNTLVHGDRDLLLQLGANLIENAIRHAGAGAEIWIETGASPGTVWLAVSDNGPGIPPAEYDNVLGRFYRLDKSRQSPGSGLGLALVKAISELHRARLSLSDAKPGLAVRIEFKPFTQALNSND